MMKQSMALRWRPISASDLTDIFYKKTANRSNTLSTHANVVCTPLNFACPLHLIARTSLLTYPTATQHSSSSSPSSSPSSIAPFLLAGDVSPHPPQSSSSPPTPSTPPSDEHRLRHPDRPPSASLAQPICAAPDHDVQSPASPAPPPASAPAKAPAQARAVVLAVRLLALHAAGLAPGQAPRARRLQERRARQPGRRPHLAGLGADGAPPRPRRRRARHLRGRRRRRSRQRPPAARLGRLRGPLRPPR